MSKNNDLWWGYCKANSIGWVLLDRTFNKPGEVDLCFVNCSDGVVFNETKERWNNPNIYSFEPNYLLTLAPKEQLLSTQELEKYKHRIDEYKANLLIYKNTKETERFAKIRQHYFTGLGIADPGHVMRTGKGLRVSHCYKCKSALNSKDQLECNSCNWMICSNCGACGCGYN